MQGQEITQVQYEQLLDDVSYLQDEAEALKYVIDQAPWSEEPAGGMSIYNKLRLIDHAQVEYYRPVIEKIFLENRILNLSDFESFNETFTADTKSEEEQNIEKVLNKIIKHRAALLNLFRKIPLIDWEKMLKNKEGKEISLFSFTYSMIYTERKILKEIADLVLVYQNEKRTREEIRYRTEQRKSSS